MNPTSCSVFVTGDIVVDRHIYEGGRSDLRDQSLRGTHMVEEAGGAALAHRLIAAVLAAGMEEQPSEWASHLACKLPETPESAKPERLTGYASWSPQPKPRSKDLFWRASKAFGYGSPPEANATS